MVSFPLKNTYAQLAWFLSPVKSTQGVQSLLDAVGQGRVHWGRLLYQANLQLCTPLWYVRLKQASLLELLPEDLQAYLAEIYQANLERNREFRSAFLELLRALEREAIPVVLLKGAATFCDDLYGDPGARMLRDLDILVPPEDTGRCREMLLALGYAELPDPNMQPDGLPTDERHHHLPPFSRPDSRVVVEVHFKVAYAQAGRVLPAGGAWQNLEIGDLDGTSVALLNPNWRLLHNTVHALIPHGEYIRGEIALQQLAEFAALCCRYEAVIDWPCWLNAGKQWRLASEFTLYLILASRLMGIFLPLEGVSALCPRLHLARVIQAGDMQGRIAKESLSVQDKFLGTLLRIYYLLHLPLWFWRNVCYTEEPGHKFVRVRFLIKKLFFALGRARP